MTGPVLLPQSAHPWSALNAEQRVNALAAALLPFASSGSIPLVEAAGACLLRLFQEARRDPPQPLPPQRRQRLHAFCRRAARRVLDGRVEDPFPRAVVMKPAGARAPQDHRLSGVYAGWAFYEPRKDV